MAYTHRPETFYSILHWSCVTWLSLTTHACYITFNHRFGTHKNSFKKGIVMTMRSRTPTILADAEGGRRSGHAPYKQCLFKNIRNRRQTAPTTEWKTAVTEETRSRNFLIFIGSGMWPVISSTVSAVLLPCPTHYPICGWTDQWTRMLRQTCPLLFRRSRLVGSTRIDVCGEVVCNLGE